MFRGIFMESLWNPRGLGGGLGVNFTEVCTLTPEFWDIPWVQSSGNSSYKTGTTGDGEEARAQNSAPLGTPGVHAVNPIVQESHIYRKTLDLSPGQCTSILASGAYAMSFQSKIP
jgi:hypothetical protein